MLLLYYVEFAGIHTDPSLRFGGNRLSKLAVRSDDRTGLKQVGFRAAVELHPSFPPTLLSGSGSSDRSFKAINKDMPHSRKLSPVT